MVKETSELAFCRWHLSPREWVENVSPRLLRHLEGERDGKEGMIGGGPRRSPSFRLGFSSLRPHPFQIAHSSLSVGGIYQGLTPPQL